jgi:SAM-dependent methyltransferase
MRSDAVRERERRERETFSKIASERSAVSEEDLVIDPAEITRYRSFTEGGATPVLSIEKVFELTAPRGKRVLEICCHHGENGALLALLGGEVDSVDIAEPLVELAKQRIVKNGLEGKQRAHVMSVHELEFPDATFDVVFGKASLHHLDLGLARREVHRVLKPGGYAVFSEPVQLLPGMSTLRRWVPITPDAESPDERPLSKADLDEFCRPFSRVETFGFRLFSRLDRLSDRLLDPMSRLDRRIFDRFPQLAPLGGLCVFRVWK